MHLPSRLLSLLPALAAASPVNLIPRAAANPGYFVLAGDSTTASPSGSGGGWGDGFLDKTLTGGASGKNYGHNGATTASFREDGDWDEVLGEIKDNKGSKSVWVTIQFGHNDQKDDSGVTLEQYSANLKKFAQEVKDAGGNPILITPLSRRSFSGGKVKEDLAEQRSATLAVAQENGVLALDLNEASVSYLNAIGEDNAHRYNRVDDDNTHLNVAGGEVFGNMVSWLMNKSDKASELGQWTQPEEKIVTAFEEGTFYFPGES
ncbi:putative esterase [Phyllosticta citribraziliensis]|uniref:Esterase n=1 Tax=Phyllosticta citribraziliensis TaxID=989973 RepID=A0ABR1L8L6_9PEZI